MLETSPDLIKGAMAVIGTDGITEEEMGARVLEMTGDAMLARRLIDWLPEAFAMVLIPHMAKVNLPTTFNAKSHTGQWVEFKFQAEPIFADGVRFGMEMYHSGPRNIFSKIVLRSCLVDAVNNALNQGSSIDGATLSGPALIGIPAEVYLPKPKSLWRRFFR